MGVYKALRDSLYTLVQGVELNGSPAFGQVSKEPLSQFTSVPAATIVPAEVPSEIETTHSNLRQYGFNIHLHYPLDQDEPWGDAIDTLLDVADATLDALDKSQNLNNQALALLAASLDWDVASSGDKLQIFCTISVVAKVSISVV